MPTNQVSSGSIQLEVDPGNKLSVSSGLIHIESQPGHKISIPSAVLQLEVYTPPTQKNITSNALEILAQPIGSPIRISENVIETMYKTVSNVRISEFVVEALISSNLFTYGPQIQVVG